MANRRAFPGMGELGRRAGLAPSALRYYERVGLSAHGYQTGTVVRMICYTMGCVSSVHRRSARAATEHRPRVERGRAERTGSPMSASRGNNESLVTTDTRNPLVERRSAAL